MRLRLILLLALLSSAAFADCVGYSDIFDVRVLDAKYRPIEGAAVQVKYDRGATYGDKYFVTPVQYSDSSGKVNYKIFNQGTTTRTIDCSIYINATAGGSVKSVKVTAEEHGPIVDVVFTDVYPVDFYVKDQYNAPIKDASVALGSDFKKTDGDGLAEFYFKKGTYDYLASFMEAKQAGKLTVSNDTEFNVLFSYYNIQIDVMDDFEQPLNATLEIFNRTFQLEDGHFEYNKTFGNDIPYTVTYKGEEKTGRMDASDDPVLELVYDIHAPLFGDITSTTSANFTKLRIEVSDPGEHASGIDIPSFAVFYRMEPSSASDAWNKAVTFSSAYQVFTADFPQMPPNRIVKFRIEMSDYAGNKANIDGQFSTYEPEDPTGTQNQTGTQENKEEEQEIPLIYIIGGVILIIIGIYLVIRIKSMTGGGQ